MKHYSMWDGNNYAIIVDDNSVHVEELTRHFESNESVEQFKDRVQHRIDWLDSGLLTEVLK